MGSGTFDLLAVMWTLACLPIFCACLIFGSVAASRAHRRLRTLGREQARTRPLASPLPGPITLIGTLHRRDRELVLERNLMDAQQLDRILSAEVMTRPGIVDEGSKR